MKNLDLNTVYTFKLISGEEITAKIANKDSDTHIEVKQPISMVIGPQGLQMMPSLFSANPDKNVKLNINSIAMVAEARDDVSVKYVEATTGITTPPPKQIITG